jgi:hypothetical protein
MIKNCLNCGGSFETFPSYIKKGGGRYCSRSCAMLNIWTRRDKSQVTNLRHWSGRKRLDVSGEQNTKWKGSNVGYRALHQWVVRMLGQPPQCKNCGVTGIGRKMHWANKSHLYKRLTTDWVRLCAKCHKAYDRNELVLP